MPLYETRKVLRVGERSYAISIPKEWAKRLNIKPGDLLELVLHDNGIIEVKPIDADSEHSTKYRILTFDDKLDLSLNSVKGIIEAAYCTGVNKIRLKNNRLSKTLVKDIISIYPGVITNLNNGFVMINIALSEELLDWKEVYHDILVLLREYYDLFETVIEADGTSKANDMEKLYYDINKNILLLMRLCGKSIYIKKKNGRINPYSIFETIKIIKLLVSVMLDFSKNITEPLNENQLYVVKRLDKVLFDSLSLIENENIEKIIKLHESINDVRKLIEDDNTKYRGYLYSLYILVEDLVSTMLKLGLSS
ncbi:AbrB/MazE/SpoVT family DNA-binding domain-containing protein [Desulfurococcaceae archaeon MEX13E-LK6-19]|nr:AbrB/MazE/SpoVT family DNA-binding domain-containing protein [Desulfurococcaceae archaeon MEX13E-LK6-19]